MVETVKYCPSCKQDKDISQFNKNKNRHDGLDWQCKECRSNIHFDKVNKKDIKVKCPTCGIIRNINRFQKHKIDIKETTGQCMKCSIINNRIKLDVGEASFNKLYSDYDKKGVERGYTFNFTKDEFRTLTKQNCHYCGKEPSNIMKNKIFNGSYTYSGIDRKDNSLGYTIENCVPCCKMCNISKHHHGYNEYKNWIRQSYMYQNINDIQECQLN